MKKPILIALGIVGGMVTIVVAVIITVGVIAYNSQSSNNYVDDYGTGTALFQSKEISESPASATDSIISYRTEENGTTSATSEIAFGEKIIKTGSMSIIVDDLDDAYKSVKDLLSPNDAYIVNVNDTGKGNERVIYITIRVNADNFDSLLEKCKSLGTDMLSTSVSTTDVTKEYIDLQASIKNLKASESQLQEIMKKAEKVEDILSIQRELTSVRSQIESIQGQINYYDNQTKYSTLTLSMSLSPENLSASNDKWLPLGTLKQAFAGLVAILKTLANVIIWLLVLSPLVLVPLAIVLVIRKIKKSRQTQK